MRRAGVRRERERVVVVRRVEAFELDRPAERLRVWCLQSGVTLGQLAKRAGYKGSQGLAMMWSREAVDEDQLRRLSDAMGVSLGWWSEPFPRYRRPPRGALTRALDREAVRLAGGP